MTFAGNVNVRTIKVADTFNQSITAGDYIFKDANGDPVWFDISNPAHMGQRLTEIGFLTLQVSFTSGGVLSMAVKDPVTGVIYNTTFMMGDLLRASALYIFTVAITEGKQVNFSYSLDSTVQYAVLTSHGGVY